MSSTIAQHFKRALKAAGSKTHTHTHRERERDTISEVAEFTLRQRLSEARTQVRGDAVLLHQIKYGESLLGKAALM
jgi:hypothetical protein